jgi:hypothetical protein
MTGKEENGAGWHHTTIVIQPDIYQQAREQGIDISDACNRALASLTGKPYHPRQRDEATTPPPVIIARNGATPHPPGEIKKAASQKLHPVINADDPTAAAKVVQAKGTVKKVPSDPAAPGTAPETEKEKPAVPPAAPVASTRKTADRKEKTASSKKKTRGDALKTFFSSKIVRTDDAGAAVSKDQLYELFARYCREHRISPVPERKAVAVALKNQFALSEELSDGNACWTGIRLK